MSDGTTLTKSETLFTEQGKMLDGDQLAEFSEKMNEKDDMSIQLLEAVQSINYLEMVGAFIFFFLAGYLMYAALFAAIGSAVDNEADTQQFMLPITIPLILSLVMSQFIISNPDGPVAFWLSMFPLTSPVIMMIRIPFGVPYTELFASMAILILAFFGATWLAGKIYRTGILMYGKKVSYRELWKWLRYSQ
jgi:ABC-2 type transport system permease protein